MAKVIPPISIEFYKVLFEQARDGIFIADGDGRYIDVNDSGHRMLGYEPGTLVGKYITDILRLEDHLRLATEMSLLKAGESLTREWSLVRKDGSLLDAEITAQQLSNKQLLGVVRDISDRKAVEDGILHLAKGASGRGQTFFQSMVEYLAKGLRADYAFAGHLIGQNHDRVRTDAVWAEGTLANDFEYELKNTPCANVIGQKVCFYPCDVQALFDQDELLAQMGVNAYIGAPVFDGVGQALGIVVALWKKPCVEYRYVEPMLQVFAARAGAEWERGRAEDNLRNSLQRLSLATQSGNIGIWDWDVAANELTWDEQMYALYGIRRQDFSGAVEAWEKGLHPEDLTRVRVEVSASLTKTNEFHTEFRVVWPDGQTRHIEGHGLVLRGPDGIAVRMIGTNWDITDRKRADEALRKSEDLYRTLVETAHDMIWSVDASGRFTFVNDAVRHIYGYEPAEMMGRPFMNFQTAEQAKKDLEAFARIKAGEAHFKYETEHLHRDGHPIWLSFNAIVMRDSQGTVLGTTGTARDITENKRLENQLRQVQKIESIGRLAGGVAHDFNNLLGAILGYSELAQQQIPEESNAYRFLAGITEAACRGGNLTQQLLAFARKKVVKPEVVDLNKIVAGMEPMLRRLIGEDLDFNFVPGASLCRVKVDIGSLEQVIMNLTVNARDAMLQHGKLTLETTNVTLGEDYAAKHADVKPGPYVLLAVTDTGTGMTEKVRAQIFEPFFTTKPVGQGTGLGLAMCHGIVKQAGGHIAVYSEVGTGTTFKIYLPITHENLHFLKLPPAKPMTGGTETILFVEDEALVRDCAQRALSGLGYNVIVAANGLEALDLLSSLKGPLHLLVTDVVMPKMGGPELAKKIVERFPGIKVLYSSGYTENAIVHGGILKESINFIQKPYLPSELADRIRRILDGR